MTRWMTSEWIRAVYCGQLASFVERTSMVYACILLQTAEDHAVRSKEMRASSPEVNGTPSSNSLQITLEKSLKKVSLLSAYRLTCCKNTLSLMSAISVGSIISVLVLLSSYCFGPCHLRHCHFSSSSSL